MMYSQQPTAAARLFFIVATAIILTGLYLGKDVILPVALAVLISFMLTPAVRGLERRSCPRAVAVLCVVCLAFTLVGSVGWTVANQVIQLSERLPDYKGNLIRKVQLVSGATSGRLEKASETLEQIGDEFGSHQTATEEGDVSNQRQVSNLFRYLTSTRQRIAASDNQAVEVKVVSLPPSPLAQIRTWLGPLVAPLTSSGVVIVLTMFLLFNREDTRNRIIQLLGASQLHITTEAMDEAAQRVSRLLRMQLLVNSAYGIAVATGLWLIGVPNAFLFGVLGILLRFLPYVGPWMVAAFPMALSLAVFDDWSHLVLTAFLFAGLELLLNNVVEPYVYGNSMGISSVGVILSAIFWTWLWGPVGLVLAMPLTVCLVVAGKYVPCFQFISVLIGDQGTMLSDAERYYQRLLAQDQEEAGQIVDIHQQNNDLIKTLDNVILPALAMCERDRHAGRIDQHQADFVVDATKDYFDDQHKDNSITSDAPNHVSSLPTVLCVPARDSADELVAELCQLVLHTKGISSRVASVNQLVSEVNADIGTLQPALILISALPPHVNRHTRYWCKKIQQHHPQIRIIVGVWQGEHLKRICQQLASLGASQVVHSLTEFATAAATAHLATVGESNPSAVASLATT